MSQLMAKARTAARSARVLFDAGDMSGAVNRAYYAMFDAARAALDSVEPDLAIAKTHKTIIRRFGRHVVQDHGLDPTLGRIFAQTEDLRITADYESSDIDRTRAETILNEMERFVSTVDRFLRRSKP